jgi:hypothetical protein
MLPISLLTKWLILDIFKLSDGENDLEEEEEEDQRE